MKRMQHKIERFFGNFSDEFPREKESEGLGYRRARTNFKETPEAFAVELELPGVDKEDISLEVVDDAIEIRARKRTEKEEKKEGVYFYARSYSGFARTIRFSDDADLEKIDARYSNGLLIVEVLKKKNLKNKKEVEIR